MTAERFQQIRKLFEAALESPFTSRREFLHNACAGDLALMAEVERLLVAHERAIASSGAAARGGTVESSSIPPILSTGHMEKLRIGPYEVIREIARGGM